MKPLTFSHIFTTGRVITLMVQRRKGMAPRMVSSDPNITLTDEEEREFIRWKNLVSAKLLVLMTPEEIAACGAHGLERAAKLWD